jgi:signal transduction histidine kinase
MRGAVTGAQRSPLHRCHLAGASSEAMSLPSAKLVAVSAGVRMPARSVRLRLTALYGGLFLLSGAALLALTYVLVRHATAGASVTNITGTAITPSGARGMTATSHGVDLHQLLVQSAIALAIMSVVSAMLGWVVAGRVLAPLRTITARTRQISDDNLHDRLALRGPDDELKELADTIDGLLERLEAAFDAQRRFVANAAHELRTPMAGMRASLDVAMAKPGELPPQIVTLEDRLRTGFAQVDRLLGSFLALARAQQEPLADQCTLSLDDIAAAAITRHADAISRLSLTVDREHCADGVVLGSETLLSRMVENVIENAINHNQPGGWIHVTSNADSRFASLVVENAGEVLAQDDVDQLAQPFRRLGTDRTGSENGAGLGLSIVAAIAQAHGGKLDLHARSDGGLRASIELPLAAPAAAEALT